MELLDENNLKKIHNALLFIMDEIDRICVTNNINYSMCGGTLLGAVRHKGFIPWDDDFDIFMLRKDYIRFLEICKENLGNEFRVVNMQNTESYGYDFSKICLKGTKLKQKYDKDTYAKELWVDIFPLDNVPNSKLKRFFHRNINYLCLKMLEEKYDGIRDSKKASKRIVFHIFHFLNCFVKPRFLKNILVENATRYDSEESDLVCCLSGSYNYDRETQKAKIFDEYCRMKFEDRDFLAIKSSLEYLMHIYGEDYMTPPDTSHRQTHQFVYLDFGKYDATFK